MKFSSFTLFILAFLLVPTLALAKAKSTLPRYDLDSLAARAEHIEKTKNLRGAEETYEAIRTLHPFTHEAAHAIERLVDISLEKKKFGDAVLLANEYLDYYALEKVREVKFKRAMALFGMAEKSTSDTKGLSRALDAMAEFSSEFPRSPEAEQIETYRLRAENMLAYSVLEIAKFYERKRNFPAAYRRYEEALHSKYLGQYRPEALYGAAASLWQMGLGTEANAYVTQLQESCGGTRWARAGARLR